MVWKGRCEHMNLQGKPANYELTPQMDYTKYSRRHSTKTGHASGPSRSEHEIGGGTTRSGRRAWQKLHSFSQSSARHSHAHQTATTIRYGRQLWTEKRTTMVERVRSSTTPAVQSAPSLQGPEASAWLRGQRIRTLAGAWIEGKGWH
jgi:hypothetical protein